MAAIRKECFGIGKDTIEMESSKGGKFKIKGHTIEAVLAELRPMLDRHAVDLWPNLVERTYTGNRCDGYMAWLHDGLDCIACLIEGRAPAVLADGTQNTIEAAHQKHTDLRGAALGKRPPDAASCPLCKWHHRLAPDACDPPQRKFWLRLGVNVGAFCRALYDAYKDDESGANVIARFVASRARFVTLQPDELSDFERRGEG